MAHLVPLDGADRNVARVALRVAAGAHNVPEANTRGRFPKTVAAFPAAISLAHEAYVYDNSSSAKLLQLEAALVNERLVLQSPTAQAWVKTLVQKVNQRADELEAILVPLVERGFSIAAARLRGGSSSGPIQVFEHDVVQCDPLRRHAIVHDKTLLPPTTEQHATIAYQQGVAAIRPLQQRER